MGWFQPTPPPFDLEEWRAKPYLARLKPLVPGLGGQRLRHARTSSTSSTSFKLVLFSVGALPVDLPDHPGARRPRRHRRLVDRADRLPEARRLDDAVGDPRPRLGLDAARLPLLPADRRRPLLAPARHRAPAPVAGQGPADRAAPRRTVARRRPLRRRPRLRRSTCCSRGERRRELGRPPRPDRDRGPARAPGACSACATRSPSSAPGPRSTAVAGRLAVPARDRGSSAGSSCSSASGGAPPPRS